MGIETGDTFLLRAAREDSGCGKALGSCRIKRAGGIWRTDWTVRGLPEGEYGLILRTEAGDVPAGGSLRIGESGTARIDTETKDRPFAAGVTDAKGEILYLSGAVSGRADLFPEMMKNEQSRLKDAEKPKRGPETCGTEERETPAEQPGKRTEAETESGSDPEPERVVCAAKRKVWAVKNQGGRGWLIERREGEDEPPIGWDGAREASLFGRSGWLYAAGKPATAVYPEKVRVFLPENGVYTKK